MRPVADRDVPEPERGRRCWHVPGTVRRNRVIRSRAVSGERRSPPRARRRQFRAEHRGRCRRCVRRRTWAPPRRGARRRRAGAGRRRRADGGGLPGHGPGRLRRAADARRAGRRGTYSAARRRPEYTLRAASARRGFASSPPSARACYRRVFRLLAEAALAAAAARVLPALVSAPGVHEPGVPAYLAAAAIVAAVAAGSSLAAVRGVLPVDPASVLRSG